MSWFPLIIPLLAILVLLPPLFRPGRDEEADRESRVVSLREQRRMLVGAIRELDFDHAMGKLSDSDHGEERERLKREVARMLERIREEEEDG